MPEQDCSKHTKSVVVKLDTSKLTAQRRSEIIAAQLRVLAEYTDGYCAAEGADDDDIVSSAGMKFWFTTDAKRTKFKNRVRWYLSEIIFRALTIS